MLIFKSSDGDDRFEQALLGMRNVVDEQTRWAAACAPYRRVFGPVYRTGWLGPFGFIFRPELDDITRRELGLLKAEEVSAVRRVERIGGPIILAFGNPKAGRECAKRLYQISGRYEWKRGEEP